MVYTLQLAITDTRRHLKDTTENVWTNSDVTYFINEAITLIKNTVPEYFTTLIEVTQLTDTIVIQDTYKMLIPLFASARCFEQDEQNYRAVKQMNEFENRRSEMEEKIYESEEYAAITNSLESENVTDVYFGPVGDDGIE